MKDHDPRSMPNLMVDFAWPRNLSYIIAGDRIFDSGSIGDSAHQDRHSWHTHYYVDDMYSSWIRECEADVRAAHAIAPGWARHATVKTARDELRRLRKAYVRRMGWHR